MGSQEDGKTERNTPRDIGVLIAEEAKQLEERRKRFVNIKKLRIIHGCTFIFKKAMAIWVSYIADIKIKIHYPFKDMVLMRVGKQSMKKQP